jgi:hypothetical protein
MSDATGGMIEKIERSETGGIVVRLRGADEPVKDAKIARCFPWSLPECYVSICTNDGKEVALLNSLDALDPESRKVVEGELRDKIFNPKIRRIISHNSEFGVISIEAETDRGEVTFQIRTRDDIRYLSPTRALFRDADGNIYELPDVRELDAASRKWLERYF